MRRTVSRFPARVCSLLLLVILAANLAAAPIPVARAAATWYVAPTGNDVNDCQTPASACATITGALSKAAPGDTLSLVAGFYFENVTISKNIAITGAGAAITTIDADLVGTVVTISAGVTASIAGVTISSGSAIGNGGGIDNQGTLTLTDAIVQNNQGGSAIISSGALTIANSTLANNTGV